MKKILISIFQVAAILVLFSSCKKDHDTTPPVPACLLSEESWFTLDEGKLNIDWKYEFDSNNHLVKGTGFFQETSPDAVTVSGNVITIDLNGSKRIDTYTGDLWGGTPDSLTAVFPQGNLLRTYKFTYNDRKQIVAIRVNTGLSANLAYDTKGNLVNLTIYNDAFPDVTYYSASYTDYDDHPSPYPALPYWKFMNHNSGVLSLSTAAWPAAISGHNPGKIRIIQYVPQSKTYDAHQTTYAYSYDTKGRIIYYAETYQRDGEEPQRNAGFNVYFKYPCK